MKTYLTIFFITLPFFAISSAVIADKNDGYGKKTKKIEKIIEDLDKNQDGKLSRLEATKEREEIFSDLDSSNNNSLTLEEFSKLPEVMKKRRLAKKFNRLDRNNDGRVSELEFTDKLPLFNRFDKNNDDIVTLEEVRQHKMKKHSKKH